MSPSPRDAPDLARLKLTGRVGDADRAFSLSSAANTIGSSAANHVVLDDRSVSRRHAVLHAGPDGPRLEDLGSKNGTFVGDLRVRESQVRAGDRLRFGNVVLELVAVEPADARLGLALDSPKPADAAHGPAVSATYSTALQGGSASWLNLVERLVEHRQAAPRDLGGALALVASDLGLDFAALLQDGETLAVRAASGTPGALGRRSELQRARRRARAADHGIVFETTGAGDEMDGPPLTCAAWARPDGPFLLALGGELEGRQRSQFLVAVVLRLLAGPPRADPPPAPRRRPGLVLPDGFVVGPSAAMAEVLAQLRDLAAARAPVLITGETGVGKELAATILHRSSARAGGPFVAINCAAIPADMMEAELFGIARGAATGVSERAGKLVEADGGTLLLDEIGDMPPNLQAKLLRVLQDGVVTPVGGRPRQVDVRLVSATHRDLRAAMDAGEFRPDLYFRLAGFVVDLPPLRRRRDDLPVLLEHFLRRFADDAGKRPLGLSEKALETLQSYPWPGNVRELEHEARRLVQRCGDGEVLDSSLLGPHLAAPGPVDSEDFDTLDLETHLQRAEARLLRHVLQQTDGNRSQAARLLGISRNGLLAKIRRLGLDD